MLKSDIDALVMHLLVKHASENGSALGRFPNQIASERLCAPLARIKRLRYEGSLKFGDSLKMKHATNLFACYPSAFRG